MQRVPLGGMGSNIPEVTKNLLIINVIAFFAIFALQEPLGIDIRSFLGLHLWNSEAFNPYQLVTNMFMHGDWVHLFFNMFILWMFGTILERVWGAKRFLMFYMIAGIGASLLYLLAAHIEIAPNVQAFDNFLDNPSVQTLEVLRNHGDLVQYASYDAELTHQFNTETRYAYNVLQQNPDDVTALNQSVDFMTKLKAFYLNSRLAVGASGAIYGLLMAFGMMFPNQVLYIYFLFPIKAKYLVIILGAIELFMGVQNMEGDNVAHFAHLGGMLFGYLIMRQWGWRMQK